MTDAPKGNTRGETLRALRDDKGWSQTELEARSGVPQTLISRMELNKIANPGVNNIRALARALGVPMSRLTGDPSDDAAEGNGPTAVERSAAVTISLKALHALAEGWRRQLISSDPEDTPTAEDFVAVGRMVSERGNAFAYADDRELRQAMSGWLLAAQSLRRQSRPVTLDGLLLELLQVVPQAALVSAKLASHEASEPESKKRRNS